MTYNIREATEQAAARLRAGCDDTRRVTLAVSARARIQSIAAEIESAADLGGDLEFVDDLIRMLSTAQSHCGQLVRDINHERRERGLDDAEPQEDE